MRYLTLVLSSLTAAAAAQLPTAPPEPTRGVFAALPFGFVFHEATNNPGGGSMISRKPAGITSPVPAILTPFPPPLVPDVPDFTATAITAGLLQGLGITGVALEFDAISTGNDLTPIRYDFATDTFVFDPSWTQQWADVFFSVADGSLGVPGGWIHHRHGPSGVGPGAEVLGFYVEGSALPGVLPGNVYLEQGTDDFQVGSYPAPAGRPDIVALDLFMPLIVDRGGVPDPAVMPSTRRLYFSVTSACANQIAQAGPTFGGVPVAVTGATIFALNWYPWTGSWGGLMIPVRHDEDLEFDADADIDALAVGPGLAGPMGNVIGPAYMFSLKKAAAGLPPTAQLLVFAPEVDDGVSGVEPKLGEPRRRNGLPLPQGADIGLEDEIDGICVADPELGQLAEVFGIPIKHTEIRNETGLLGFSMSRPPLPTGDVLRCVVSGWAGAPDSDISTSLITVKFWLPSLYPNTPFYYPVQTLRQPTDGVFQFDAPIPAIDTEVIAIIYQNSMTGMRSKSYPLRMRL